MTSISKNRVGFRYLYVLMGILVLMVFGWEGKAQDKVLQKDSVPHAKEQQKEDKLRITAYMRVISNANGFVRMDQNIVSDIRLSNFLRMEAGFRYGESPPNLNSYCYYKIELQTKPFWEVARVVARISDNVVNYPSPYRKTNTLFIAETKHLVLSSFQAFLGAGYVFSYLQNNKEGPLPVYKGIQDNYPIFKLAIRYAFGEKGFIEAIYGSYDVFNPYGYNSPFIQMSGELTLSASYSLMSYVRYQYMNNLFNPDNYFMGMGITYHRKAVKLGRRFNLLF